MSIAREGSLRWRLAVALGLAVIACAGGATATPRVDECESRCKQAKRACASAAHAGKSFCAHLFSVDCKACCRAGGSACEIACGNHVVSPGEECDDGNSLSGDGCDANCTVTGCGNGIVTPPEACDDGDANSDAAPDRCRTNCTRPRCGDGVVDTGETCEPPGTAGCSDRCTSDCVPSPEVCDGQDNDCDGAADEELGTQTCGTGACTRTVAACVNGTPPACGPGTATTEVCDGQDNDCDGATDEELGTQTCGTGACTRSVAACVNGTPPACVPGTPTTEGCDGQDNDCDGATDEGLGTQTCGVGACTRTVPACANGTAQECVPGDPSSEVCDRIDNDCDGDIDELDDCQAPSIAIDAPAGGFLTRGDVVDVTGVVSATVTSVDVSGVTAVLAGGRFVASPVPLREGLNTLLALARTADGLTASASVTVIRDTAPPSVIIETPAEGGVVTASTVTVTGAVNDVVVGTVNAEDCRVVVSGRLGSANGVVRNRSFLVDAVALALGTNVLTAVATDTAGNVSAPFSVTITRRAPSPGLRLEIVAGDGQSGVVREPLAAPLAVRAVDAAGAPLSGRLLEFAVVRNDGVLRGVGATEEAQSLGVLTGADGRASVEWALGTRAGVGNNRVEVRSAGFDDPVTFTASAAGGPCEKLLAISGENQVGLAGSALARPFEVFAVDAGGNVCAGLPVTFRVDGGGGNLGGALVTTVATNDDGRVALTLVLGPDAGVNNNVVSATFDGIATQDPVFLASAVVPSPTGPARLLGVVLDTEERPIPHATVALAGTDPPIATFTGDDGTFVLQDVPPGAAHLFVGGSTTTRPGVWPPIELAVEILPGTDNTLGMPIFLPQLDEPNFQEVGGAENVVLRMAGVEGFGLEVLANSVSVPGAGLLAATSQVVTMGVTQVSSDQAPMPPSGGAAPPWVGTFQPPGIHFDPPARLIVPNSDGLPPGQIIELFSFDHDLGQYVSAGTATVQPDGATIVSDPGSGIAKSGWFFASPPPPPSMRVRGVVVGPGGSSGGVAGATVTARSRSVRVNSDGTFLIPNVPAAPGLFRARAVSFDAGLLAGVSGFFAAELGETIDVGTIELGDAPPAVESLATTVVPDTLTAEGQSAQITVVATLADGSMPDVTAGSTGTTYVSSNAAIATVGPDGLVTARTDSGAVIVSISNDGVFTSVRLVVNLGADRDGDGVPNDFEDLHRSCGLNSRLRDADRDPDADGLANGQEFLQGTDPCVPDTDGDTLLDGNEVTRGTNPTRADTDGDRLLDGEEVIPGADGFVTDPLDRDTDGGGLDDGVERDLGFDPTDPSDDRPSGDLDTDGDGITDADEVDIGTDPNDPDTDDDGLRDGFEVLTLTDPLDATDPCGRGLERDFDADGLGDCEEPPLGTDPSLFDTDGDDLCDGVERFLTGTDPLVADSDGDGLDDGDEFDEGTDPFRPDTDGDGVRDGAEDASGLNPLDPTDAAADADLDGLGNAEEVARGTDVFEPDSDGDTLRDGEEVHLAGTDPLIPDTDGAGRTDGQEVLVDSTDPRNPFSEATGYALPLSGLRDGSGAVWTVNANGSLGVGTSRLHSLLNLDTDSGLFSFGFFVGRTAVADFDVPGGSAGGAFPRELVIGPALGGDLRLVRKVFVPGNDRFVRVLEVIDNLADTETVATLEARSFFRVFGPSGALPIEIVTTSNGDALADAGDDFVVTHVASSPGGALLNPPVAHVFSGPFARLEPSSVRFASEFDPRRGRGFANLTTTFTVRIPPGGRIRLLQFASVSGTDAGAVANATRLAGLGGAALSFLSPEERASILNFVALDADGDGLSDAEEAARGTRSDDPDSDGDGLRDGFEVAWGFDPRSAADGGADPDGDGLDNLVEQTAGTNPTNADSDGDGIRDGAEVSGGTNPRSADTDADGLRDADEAARGTDPRDPDSDDDGLGDGDEIGRGTDPLRADTDGDGIPDGVEVRINLDPLDASDAGADPDDDGLVTRDELQRGTNPRQADTDLDALLDGEEVQLLGTDPRNRDTDRGGRSDGEEVLADGTNPLVATDDRRNAPVPIVLRDGLSFRWPVYFAGTIQETFFSGFNVSVSSDGQGGVSFSAIVPTSSGPGSPDGAFVGPNIQGALRFSRKIFVPRDDAFVRYLEILDNPTREPRAAFVSINSSEFPFPMPRVVVSTSSGDLTGDLADDFVVTDDGDVTGSPALAYVFSGPNARQEPGGVFANDFNRGSIGVSFQVTVPPGGRTILMHFGARRTARADAIATATRLSRLGGRALEGITPEEQAQIVNFFAFPDADADGLSDADEATRGTNPTSADTDADGLSDGYEVANGLDPRNPADGPADTDGDGLANPVEQATGTDPRNPDTDGDGLNDGAEVARGTDPRFADTDEDGLGDGTEVANGTDPQNPDTDADGLTDADEVARGSDPLDPDGDGDGVADGRDNCRTVRNPDQADADFDGGGDACQPTLAIRALVADGDSIDVDVALADPNADPLAGTVRIESQVSVALTRRNSFRDVLEAGRFVERPNGRRLLESSFTSSGQDFEFACGACDALENGFRPTFFRVCGDSNSQLAGRTVCVRSTVTGALFTLRFTSWAQGGGSDTAATYVRSSPTIGPVPFAGSILPGPLDISSLVDGADQDLIVAVDDGTSVPVSAHVPLRRQGEPLLRFVTFPDTDGDRLVDPVETATGTFADGFDTGTRPGSADSDGDGVGDGEEVLDLRSDPTDADSDGDGRSDGAEANVLRCLARLRAGNAVQADPFCAAAAAADPGNPEASLLAALTGLAVRVDAPLALDLLRASGGEGVGSAATLCGLSAVHDGAIPPDAPDTTEVLDAIRTSVPAADAALAHLARIPAGATIPFDPDNLPPCVRRSGLGPVEIDSGDVLVLRATLEAAAAAAHAVAAYDFGVDADDAIANRRTAQQVFLANPLLLTLRPGGTTELTLARIRLDEALAALVAAIDVVVAETDDQADDALVIPAADRAQVGRVRLGLQNLRTALTGQATFAARTFGLLRDQRLTLAPFFMGTMTTLRPLVPGFDALGRPDLQQLPDATFGGLAPDMTRCELGRLLTGRCNFLP